MSSNPYQALLDAFEGGSSPAEGLVLGRVTSAAPLKVLVGGNTMEAAELLCNADLVATAEVVAQLAGTGSITGGDMSLSGPASFELTGTMARRNVLAAGDQLLMLPIEDAQRYIILCKVVGL